MTISRQVPLSLLKDLRNCVAALLELNHDARHPHDVWPTECPEDVCRFLVARLAMLDPYLEATDEQAIPD